MAVRRLKLIAFSPTGGAAALGRHHLCQRVASDNPSQGAGLMLIGIAAVFLGSATSEHGEPRLP